MAREQPKWKRRTREQRRRTFMRDHRKARDLTQQDVADEFNTSKATISRIENGYLPYNQDFIELYADFLGVHPAALISQPPATDARAVGTSAKRKGRRK